MNNEHLGSDFDDFLKEEGLLDSVTETALKKVEHLAKYVPNSFQCQTCTKRKDCDKTKLDFSEMSVIRHTQEFLIVNCTNYKKVKR